MRTRSRLASSSAPVLPRADKGAAAGDDELGPRQLLRPRVRVEHVGIAQCPRRVGGGQHRLDRIPVEPQMIVADGAATQQLFALSQQPVLLGLVIDRASSKRCMSSARELRADIATHCKRLTQHFSGFRFVAGLKEDAGVHFKPLRFEPPRAQLSAEAASHARDGPSSRRIRQARSRTTYSESRPAFRHGAGRPGLRPAPRP